MLGFPPSLDPAGSQQELAGRGRIPGILVSLTPFPSPHGGLEWETKQKINGTEQSPLPFPALPAIPGLWDVGFGRLSTGIIPLSRDLGFIPAGSLMDPGKPEQDWLEFHPMEKLPRAIPCIHGFGHRRDP